MLLAVIQLLLPYLIKWGMVSWSVIMEYDVHDNFRDILRPIEKTGEISGIVITMQGIC